VEDVRLAKLEQEWPAPGESRRNPFTMAPAPPPPSATPSAPSKPVDAEPAAPAAPPGPPPPPPIPPILLKYTMHIKDIDGRERAFLVDRSGASFQAVAGDIVDGKYKLYRVTPTSVEMSWLDGTGRRTIPLNGG